jgi:hypothetical protein
MKKTKTFPIDSIEAIELLTQKRQGWNARRDQPCTITIDGGCEVHAIPAWLWQPRIRPHVVRFDTQAVPMRRVR